MAGTPSLRQLLRPRSVAIVGSVSRPDGVGARTARHLEAAGFGGEVVRASRPGELDRDVDVALVGVPAAAVAETLDALRGSAAHAVVYSAGFDEAGGESLARFHGDGLSLLGPNTVGAYYAPSRAVLTFAAAFDDLVDCRGGSGAVLVSQSGAFGARLVAAARRRGLDLDGFVATGNEDGLSAADVVTALAADEELRPRVVLLYLESVRDGDALRAALAAAREHDIATAVLLGGRSSAAADAAASHTAAVSPDGDVLASVCELCGAVPVRSDRELVDAGLALSLATPAAGVRAAVVTGSGGAGVVATDLLDDAGVDVVRLGTALQDSLRQLLPGFAATANPVDVTAKAIADTELLGRIVERLAASGEVDAVLAVARLGQAPALAEAGQRASLPVVCTVLDGDVDGCADLARRGVLVAPDLAAGTAMLAALARLAPPAQAPSGRLPPLPLGAAAVDRSASESLRLVQQAGVAVAEWRRADSVAAAEAAADALGGPVVVKADLPASTHKRRAGGVRLGVHRQDVALAAKELLDLAPAVLVARELRGGPELFVGVRRDPTFGLVVVAGLGGGHMELLDRTVLAPADAPAAWFTERLHRRLLHRAGDDGWRLAEALAVTGERLVDVARRTGADLVECNPLIERDGGLVALDARVV